MNPELLSTPGIYLVGFMGSGKSSVGPILSEELGWRFLDIDNDVEQSTGTTISVIFETKGEAAFRVPETEAIMTRVREIQCGEAAVVALGGGAFAQEGIRTLLKGNGISIWLDCPLEVIRERVAKENHRPLARDPERFADLYEARRACYSNADYRVDASVDGPASVARLILSLPIF